MNSTACSACNIADGNDWDSTALITGGGNPALDNVTDEGAIAYVRTCTPEEEETLANCARLNLKSGWWTGGEPEDGEPEAIALLETPTGRLSDAFVVAYAHDLAGELRLGRGQCPHRLSDQRAYIDGWNQHEPLTEVTL